MNGQWTAQFDNSLLESSALEALLHSRPVRIGVADMEFIARLDNAAARRTFSRLRQRSG